MNPRRWPRPLMMFLAVVTAVLLVWFFIRIGSAVVRVYDRAADDFRPVPDMSGGIAAIIAAIATLIPAIIQFVHVFQGYHVERMDEQARGLPPGGVRPTPPPAVPAEDMNGSAVNPHGGPGAP